MYTISTSQKIPTKWRNESTQRPSEQAVYVHESNAADILKNAHTQMATVWTGGFHNAKQVLTAMKEHVRRLSEKTKNAPADIQTVLHVRRMRQTQQSRVLNMLATKIGAGFQLSNPRMPNIRTALADVYAEPNDAPFLLPLNQLLNFIGTHEWHKGGIGTPQLGGKIHVPFGVFSSLRGEYLDLIAQAPLNPHIQMTSDIGTGSGVTAAILAKRGIPEIIAIDTNPKAVTRAIADLAHLGLNKQVAVQAVDLFPKGHVDLIVCNPPWLPVKPTSVVKTVLYDPDSAVLTALLDDVWQHLNPQDEAWLITSDLVEHLHLRDCDLLERCFQTASLSVVGILETKPRHRRATGESDPFVFACNRKATRLYRLETVR